MSGWYYLHVNGELIYKPDPDAVADIRESDFAVALWPMELSRPNAWRILVEASAFGANKARVEELASKWNCTNDDAEFYARYAGALLSKDGDKFCATRKDFVNLQESPAGFGDTALEALAALAKELGIRPSKMWGASFHDLLKEKQ